MDDFGSALYISKFTTMFGRRRTYNATKHISLIAKLILDNQQGYTQRSPIDCLHYRRIVLAITAST